MRWKSIGALVLTLIVFASQAYGYKRAVKSIRLIPWGRTMITATDSILLNMIRESEGFKAKPYHCPAGKWTIGYGYNMEAHGIPPNLVKPILDGTGVTKAQADELLTTEVEGAIDWALDIFYPHFGKFTETRQRVIVDMIFNMGPGVPYKSGFRSFKKETIPAMIRGDWEQAASNILKSKYAKDTKSRAVRNAELLRKG